MRQASCNRRLMARRFHNGRDGVSAVRRLAAAEIDHAVLEIDRAHVMVGAGIGAGRVACDQVEDFKPVFDRAQAVFEGTFDDPWAWRSPCVPRFRNAAGRKHNGPQ